MERGQDLEDNARISDLFKQAEEPQRRPVFREWNDSGEESGAGEADVPVEPSDAGQESVASTLHGIAVTLEAEPPAPPEGSENGDKPDGSLFPMQPRTLGEIGLSNAFLTDLTLKIIHYTGTPSAAQLMRRLGLGQALVQQIMSHIQEDRLCEVLSQSDLFTGNYRYRLSERGTTRAMEALERTRYAGPVPVTAEQYVEIMHAQREQRTPPSREQIQETLESFVLSPSVADAVARALYSGKSTLLYGASGNGKTSVLEAFARNVDGAIIMPYAIYAYGQVIRVFDASIHQPVEEIDDANSVKDEARVDRRWLMVKRPTVILGSEISLDTLDLAYDPQARFYQAPPHIKAQGGILLLDDVGRQRIHPRDLMTRLLIAAERGWDSLNLSTGEKLTAPFDVQLLFATNQSVGQLVDDSLLRRILYKIDIQSPGPTEFAEILRRLCHERGVQAPDGMIERIVERLFSQPETAPRAAYARDLVNVIIEGAGYDGGAPVLNEETFDRAYGLFMSQHSPSLASGSSPNSGDEPS